MTDFKSIATELEDFLKKKTKEASDSIAASEAADKSNPSAIPQTVVKNESVLAIRSSLAQNPIQQAGTDLLTKMGTTIVQKLVTETFKKIDLSPIQNASQNFFQTWAVVTTFDVEVAMELARNAADQIVKYTNEKDRVITDLKKELVALHNACAYLLNASPFMDAYLKDLITALGILRKADGKFSTVAGALNMGTKSKYLKNTFESGITDLETAQKLILPDRDVDVSSIRGVTDYISTTVTKTAGQTFAAAAAIPGISLRVGQLLVEYVKVVTELNLSILTFSDALDGWISSYKSSGTMYQAMYAHLQSGRAQLKELTLAMDALLFPPQPGNIDVTSLSYNAQVSAEATGWGIKNQAIIEWMKLNPGKKGATALEQTGNSVAAYVKAKELLDGYGDISYAGGTFKCAQSSEEVDRATTYVSRLLLKVNTLVAKRQTPYNITVEFRFVNNYFDTSLRHSQRIRSALSQFLATKNTLPGPARTLLNNALGTAKKYGLDRVATLIIAGRTRDIALLTAHNTTNVGAAITSINSLIDASKKDDNVTDDQITRLENARNILEAEKTAKDIEANRSYSSNSDAARVADEQRLTVIKSIVGPGIQVAKDLGKDEGQTSNSKAETAMSGVIPGFNNNNALAETIAKVF